MVRGTKHADVQGQPCIGNEFSGAHTASQASRRIVLWFMGTAEESRVLRQFWTQVRYMGCSIGAEEREEAMKETLG